MNNKIDTSKLVFPLIIAISFLLLGIHLVQKDTLLGTIIGYANIIFWSGMILFAGFRLLSQKNNK